MRRFGLVAELVDEDMGNYVSMAREHRDISVMDGNAETLDMYSQDVELLLLGHWILRSSRPCSHMYTLMHHVCKITVHSRLQEYSGSLWFTRFMLVHQCTRSSPMVDACSRTLTSVFWAHLGSRWHNFDSPWLTLVHVEKRGDTIRQVERVEIRPDFAVISDRSFHYFCAVVHRLCSSFDSQEADLCLLSCSEVLYPSPVLACCTVQGLERRRKRCVVSSLLCLPRVSRALSVKHLHLVVW